ncbi:methyltransferase type 12 [Streptomyces tateyamensis]|uniref:Methyltransferase type 12 n=1 Tax=Streptomyces tateyamensis TaxID=565073 RepID=A0A2V4NED2_9ACTN|nr:DinB family protein [Streptomyces tateyamensis]PYC78574.1 methyltransferase type 12 [Streptomyces tateyamensis]
MDSAEHTTDAIVADTKDWTWVLERACPDCGLDTPAVPPTEVPALVRANAAAWAALLAGDPAALARRPDPATWSALEYACHVRDVFRLFAYRLDLMLTQDGPLFPSWDQDETALAERYHEQDPALVGPELAEAGERIAAAFEQVADDQWQRTGGRSDGARFTVATFAQYFLHDPVHHLYDVTGERAG